MLKILKIILLMAACTGLPATASKVVEETISIGSASRILIDSKVLGENRNLLIHLPDSYTKSNKAYPVLYLLDGERHFNHSIIATQLLQKHERIPELIIIAILNNGTRQRDLNFEKENFTQFIKNELITYVDNNYRTTGLNTLYGHSLAGFFTVNLLAHKPELFRNYIAASPVLQGDELAIYKKALTNSHKNNTSEKSLYFTLSNEAEEGKEVTNALNNFVKLLTERPPEKLNWHYEFLANQTHSTVSYLTFFNGLTHVFKGYQAPRFSSYQEYRDFGGMHSMETHYKKRAETYGTDKNIPEDTLLNLASMLLSNSQLRAALSLYRQLTNDFPDSAESFSGLGQVYNLLNQSDKSIMAHQKAVRLANKQSPAWQQELFQSRLDKVNERAQ